MYPWKVDLHANSRKYLTPRLALRPGKIALTSNSRSPHYCCRQPGTFLWVLRIGRQSEYLHAFFSTLESRPIERVRKSAATERADKVRSEGVVGDRQGGRSREYRSAQ